MIADIQKYFGHFFGRIRPEAILLFSFAVAIAAATLLLVLPISHNGNMGFSEALFTATSAVCVTGLVVVDTGSDLTVFGQCVVLLFIQLGGLGVMTFAAVAFDLLGKRLSLRGEEAMTHELVHDALSHGFRLHFRRMVRLVFSIESIGALVIFIGMVQSHSIGHSAYSALFHSVSAFCNAGFSLYTDSLVTLRGNWIVIWAISSLIIIGGIGHLVLFDFSRAFKKSGAEGIPFWIRLSIHTRITVSMTILLLVAGFVLFFLTAFPLHGFDIGASSFQSITARTAGFNTVPIGNLPLSTLLILTVLMFIGGSPGSCAGGIKTTTFALWITQLWSRLNGQTHVLLQNRQIAEPLVRRASTIVSVAIIWNIVGIVVLSITEGGLSRAGLHDIIFEQISAFGTVGLSTGLTSELTYAGRLWIIATMFIGRTGPLTGVLLLLLKKQVDVRYPEGKVMIG